MVKLVFLASSSAIDDDGESDLAHHHFWSHVFVAVGFSWVVGSVLFFPTLGIDFEISGAVIFLVSSLISALGSVYGMQVIRRKMSELELRPIEHDHDDHLNYLNGHEDDGGKPHVGQNLDYHLMDSHVSNSGKDVEICLLGNQIQHDGHTKMALRGTSMLYKRLIYKVRMVNVIGFFTGAMLFAIGSVLFLPLHHLDAFHANFAGCWLYIVGTCVFLGSTLMELVLAIEQSHTSEPLDCPPPLHWSRCPDYSDQSVTAMACWSYVVGTVIFLLGAGFFFPGLNDTLGDIGTALFVVGSIFFLIGGVLDVILINRRIARVELRNSSGK